MNSNNYNQYPTNIPQQQYNPYYSQPTNKLLYNPIVSNNLSYNSPYQHQSASEHQQYNNYHSNPEQSTLQQSPPVDDLFVPVDDDDDDDINDSPSACEDLNTACTLSLTERLLGYLLCIVAGWILSISSVSSWYNVWYEHSSTRFAIWYSLGLFLNIISNFFLSGPLKHCELIIRTHALLLPMILYIISAITTITLCLFNVRSYIILGIVILQFFCYLWFTFAYCILFGCGKLLIGCIRICPCTKSNVVLTDYFFKNDDDDGL